MLYGMRIVGMAPPPPTTTSSSSSSRRSHYSKSNKAKVFIMTTTLAVSLLLSLLLLQQCSGFTTIATNPTLIQQYQAGNIVHHETSSGSRSTSFQAATTSISSTRLFGGGFGGGGGGGSNNKKSDKKKSKKGGGGGGGGGSSSSSGVSGALKPKQQWDRYLDLKKETKVRVAVRPTTSEEAEDSSSQSTADSEEWLEVGRVKSKEDKYTELAVIRQRAIIAEHAKRLYPLQFSSSKKTKPTIEWGYCSDENDSWTVPDKSILTEDAVSKIVETEGVSLEKVIGFEGRPDPATGFYVVYDGGRPKIQ